MKVKLTKANLQNIAQTTRAFGDYIHHLRGNGSVLTRQAEVRDDNYVPTAPLATKDYGHLAGAGTRRADSFGAVTMTAPMAGKSQKLPRRRPIKSKRRTICTSRTKANRTTTTTMMMKLVRDNLAG